MCHDPASAGMAASVFVMGCWVRGLLPVDGAIYLATTMCYPIIRHDKHLLSCLMIEELAVALFRVEG